MIAASAIIVSKDRALQCDGTLQSINKFCPNLFSSIEVLYKASNNSFQQGYDLLSAHKVRETDYRTNIIQLVHDAGDFVCFFTDDDFVHRNPDISSYDVANVFYEFEPLCVSMRLGLNIVIQDFHTGQRAVLPSEAIAYGPFMIWDSSKIPYYGNFRYPLSTDAHLFRREMILSILDGCEFFDPNSMECAMQQFVNCITPIMASLQESAVVGSPNNRVQNTCPNRAGEKYSYTPEYLNEQWLSGKRINLDMMDFSNIQSCHKELELHLT